MTLATGNPMTRALVALLAFEAIVFCLAIPGMIMVSEVRPAVAFAAGGTAAVLALLACALLRRGVVGYALAWLTQVVGIALGLLTPAQYFLGVIFALLWVVTFVLGRRIEAAAGSSTGSGTPTSA